MKRARRRGVRTRNAGDDVARPPRPTSWDGYLAHGRVAPLSFMEGVTDLPAQLRQSGQPVRGKARQ